MTLSETAPATRRVRPRTLVAAVLLALTALLAAALPASAVTQASAESQLRAAGITWSSSGGCTTRSNSTCTSFEQIRQTTVDGAVTPASSASGCALNITGGTEVGPRQRHLQPLQRLQAGLRKITCLDNYVTRPLHLHRAARRRLPAVPGRLRQRLRRRGQPLGHDVLHLRRLLSVQPGREVRRGARCSLDRGHLAPACPPRRPDRPRRRRPGPRSMTQSALAITSRSCSTRTTVLPASTSRCSWRSSSAMSAGCSPVVGSSSR